MVTEIILQDKELGPFLPVVIAIHCSVESFLRWQIMVIFVQTMITQEILTKCSWWL